MQSLRSRLAMAEARPWPDRPVPIALVITDLDVGGAERAMVGLATRLDRSRWRPSVICLGPEGKLAGPLRAAGIAVECLDVDRRRPIRAVGRLVRSLRAIRPALIQSFLFHANLASKLAAPFAGLPWVVGGIRVAERAKRWHLRLDRLTQRLSCGSVCVSEGVFRFARDVGRIAPERLCVIPNGIDPGAYDRAVPALKEGRKALFVGRIERQKGVPLLLDAWAAVAGEHPDWKLAIVGDGPDAPGLRGHPAPRVEWLGRRDDVPALMRSAGLLVLPSLWEGMPNVVLEAMAAGLPVLATRVEGSEDLVVADGPGRTGWLAEPADLGSLTDNLREALNSADLLPLLGAAGRARVERHYAMARVVGAYEEAWAGLLGLAIKPGGASGR